MTAVTIPDLAFLLGPLGGPALTVGGWVAVVATRQPVRAIVAVSVLGFAAMASFVTYWYFWGVGFDAADALRPVPARVEQASSVAMWVCAVAAVAVAALGVVTVAASRRRPGRHATGVGYRS